MIQQTATVVWNRSRGASVYHLGLECARGFARARPGQFVMLHLVDRIDPLLRRPFSLYRLIQNGPITEGIEILYKVVGRGTALLSSLQAGDKVDIMGPLGSAFLLPPEARRVFVVAGGIGVAPMVFLVDDLLRQGIRTADCTVFLGGRTRDELLCGEDFNGLGVSLHTTTDDGSAGDQCLVTLPMELALSSGSPDVIFACGPPAMLQCVADVAEARNIACQISIETRMACGMGACLGCAVASRDSSVPYYHACLDGPVFDSRSIRLETDRMLQE
jgi:dihydroorotate dehydrogenase electron transfer subunit